MESIKPDVSIITLQGIGNSVLALPIIQTFVHEYRTKVYLMENGSAQFYKETNLDIDIESYKNRFETILPRATTNSKMSFSLYPNWKKEFFALMNTNSSMKTIFESASSPYTKYNSFKKLIIDTDIHDIENNAKLLEKLGLVNKLNFDINFCELFKVAPKKFNKKQVSIHPTGSTALKYFPLDFWVNLTEYLLSQNYQVNIFYKGQPEEARFVKKLYNEIPEKFLDDVRLLENLKFSEIVSYLASSELFIGLDSCISHIASLMDLEVITLMNYVNYHRIYPYGNNSKLYLSSDVYNEKYRKKSARVDFASSANASSRDVIRIIQNDMTHSQTLRPKYKKELPVYVF